MVDFRRKRNRLQKPAYVGRKWYFVTLCTGGRRPIFENTQLVGCLLCELEKACTRHGFSLYAYCFMPDHVHVELAGAGDHSILAEMLRAFKGCSSTRARALNIRGLWQKGFYDHVLRPGENETPWLGTYSVILSEKAWRRT